MLSQLAGTVVYSTEHRLEPPYTVQAGETLQTIAQHYQVPWQLLAKINGVASATAIQPGQQLKVLRGPFMGIANLSTSELTLLLNGRYAGKFTITATGDSQLAEGDWVVTPASTAFTPAAPAIDRVLGLGSTTPGAAGNTLTLGSNAANIRVASRDAEELCDILSIGSRIVVRR